MEHYDILIVGGGAAGISAARAAGNAKVLLVDRKAQLGGVLLQCTHRGFGANQSGIEYAAELVRDFPETVKLALGTTVLSISKDKTALLSGPEFGRREVSFSRLILATGCREIPMGALPIAGTRPRGIYTAGQMQELMNLHDFLPEGPVVILGSGDLGLILVERKSACGGMARNQRCLAEYPIGLICSDTVAQVHGEKELTGCTTEQGLYLPCRTLLIAAGLCPERELVSHLGEPHWLHLCGNCRKVHPMVESVINEGRLAGIAAVSEWEGTL